MKNVCATCTNRREDDYGCCAFDHDCNILWLTSRLDATVRANVAASRAAREASRFADPENDDALSLTASWIAQAIDAHHEAASADAGFDGGEFSGQAHDALAHSEVAFLKRHYFEFSGVDFDAALAARLSAKAVYTLGFFNFVD
jgi:hypothetical protein